MIRKNNLKFHSQKIVVPGDKSLSHRFVLFSALAKGVSECTGFLEAEDPLHTMSCFAGLGVQFTKLGPGAYRAVSPGVRDLRPSDKPLDFGNGGTGIRLSCGLLAGVPGMDVILTGDASLQKRPMGRIVDPLQSLGADVASVNGDGKAPLRVRGKKIRNGSYTSPIASAQVKSCLMLGAIASESELEYREPELSRDHTENMLRFLGGQITHHSPTHFTIQPPYELQGKTFHIPGDISSAGFFIVLGLLADPDSVLIIENVGLNPSRIGILEVLEKMGGRIRILNKRTECGEETGDLEIRGSNLHRTEIPASLIPSIIDEIPILSIAGLFSVGGFCIRNAEELRAKESDRIHSMVSNLQKLGVSVTEYPDGYEFLPPLELKSGAAIETFMDHRIAMSFSILESVAQVGICIDDVSWVETSFPGFFTILKNLEAISVGKGV